MNFPYFLKKWAETERTKLKWYNFLTIISLNNIIKLCKKQLSKME